MITRVRVHLGATAGSQLREISVWGPAPTTQPKHAVDVDDLRRPYAELGGRRSRALAIGIAAVLAALALAAAGYAAGRRKRAPAG
ncbi:MAG: hypothetical protein V7636_1226, partial [Actinomycetota bacterium]